MISQVVDITFLNRDAEALRLCVTVILELR